jgi:hypothetical protein
MRTHAQAYRIICKIVVVFALMLVSLWSIGDVGPHSAGAAVPPGSSVLAPLATLNAPMSMTSPNGQFKLLMQSGGDLVETTQAGAQVWTSGTSSPGAFLVMQADGNLVVQDTSGHPLWASNTSGNPGGFLIIGDLGQLSVESGNGVPLWEAGIVAPGTSMPSGASMVLPGGQFRLTMQSDGNLVEYNAGGIATRTANTNPSGARAAFGEL